MRPNCCDKMELEEIAVDIIACKNCKALNEEEAPEGSGIWMMEENPYKYVGNYQGYKVIHHMSEVFKRLECREPNPPTDMKVITDSLNGDYTLANIWKTCDHKHLNYIFCKLNNRDPPWLQAELKSRIKHTIFNMSRDCKKLPNYTYIIKCICEEYKYDDIIPYLYVRSRKVKLDALINKYI